MSRRQKQLREERKRRALEWVNQNHSPFLNPLQKATPANCTNKTFLLVARVSTSAQKKDLIGQIAYLLTHANHLGAQVGSVYLYIGPGSDQTHWEEITKRTIPYDGILWESTCRMIRSPNWSYFNQEDPLPEQVDTLTSLYQGKLLLSCLEPNATFEEVRAHQTRRGKKVKEEGFLKVRRDQFKPVVEMMNKRGWGYKRIAKDLCLDRDMIRRWLGVRD